MLCKLRTEAGSTAQYSWHVCIHAVFVAGLHGRADQAGVHPGGLLDVRWLWFGGNHNSHACQSCVGRRLTHLDLPVVCLNFRAGCVAFNAPWPPQPAPFQHLGNGVQLGQQPMHRCHPVAVTELTVGIERYAPTCNRTLRPVSFSLYVYTSIACAAGASYPWFSRALDALGTSSGVCPHHCDPEASKSHLVQLWWFHAAIRGPSGRPGRRPKETQHKHQGGPTHAATPGASRRHSALQQSTHWY